MSNKEFSINLENRTKKFAVAIIQLCNQFKSVPAAKVIGYQIIKSATSIGANYREANRPVSKADFKNKVSICVKEAAETQYWLELLIEANLSDEQSLQKLHKECSELLALFTSIYQGCLRKK